MYRITEFALYEPGLVFGDNSNFYYTKYEVENGDARFTLELSVYGLCNSFNPNINHQLILNAPDSTVTCYAELAELNGGGYDTGAYIDAEGVGTLYNWNYDHDFYADPNGQSEALRIALYIRFPSQGSYTADSAYFFSNLSSARVGLIGKHPKPQ